MRVSLPQVGRVQISTERGEVKVNLHTLLVALLIVALIVLLISVL